MDPSWVISHFYKDFTKLGPSKSPPPFLIEHAPWKFWDKITGTDPSGGNERIFWEYPMDPMYHEDF